MNSLQVPCPVRVGVMKNGGLQALLHRYTLEKNLTKIEKLLKKGVDVDCVNNLGQTPLFCASLLGFIHVTELLLQYGANPNHRCEDQSTPLHAAVFSSNPWLLSGLLDAGGDLRLHDHKGKSPKDWAQAGAQENSARMLEFLKSCASHMHSLSQTTQPREMRLTPSSTTSKTLVRSPSLLELIKSGGSELHLNRKISSKSSACDNVQCFGYGKLCVEKAGQRLGLLAFLPVMLESDLVQADDEALLSFTCGRCITMTNYSWKGCRVTAKELAPSSSGEYLDLLLAEQEYCTQLFHPNLLQLMAVCMSVDLLETRLVYERVHLGSLYNLLHQKRSEYPVLRAESMLSVVLQACEALLYLHGRGLVMRALSSHSVILTHPGVAKLTGLGFMAPTEGSRSNPPAPLALPPHMYNWAAPEVVRRKPCTGKADLYSLCTLIQELYTDAVPWGPVEPHWIKHAVDSGQALAADPNVPEPYYSLVRVGLQPRPQDRTHSLQDLRYTLRCDIKELSQAGKRRSGMFQSGWCPDSVHVRTPLDAKPGTVTEKVGSEDFVGDTTLDRESLHQLKEEEEMTTDAESVLHRDLSFRDILPLQDWPLCPPARAEPESTSKEESDSSTVEEEEEEEEEEVLREQRVQPQRPSRNLSEHISSIVLNLKVSQVLLQQSQSNLDAVETGRRRQQPGAGGADEVDAELKSAASPPLALCSPAGSFSSSTNSGSVSSSASRAVGPPPQYRLLPHGVHASAKRLEAQLLTGESRGALSAEELAVWQREFPSRDHLALERHPVAGCPAQGGAVSGGDSGSAEEELSHYSSAQENGFVNTRPRNQKQAARVRSARDTESEEQPQSEHREEVTDSIDSKCCLKDVLLRPRPCLSSETSDSLEEDSPTPQPRPVQPPSKAKWTSEVSDLVARMTQGRLGLTVGSSDSEDVEDRRASAQGPSGLRQAPVGHSHSSLAAQSPPPPSQRAEEKSGAELEQIFKSFAGLQSESEEDADFHTVDRTFDLTCGVWDGAGPREEEGTSESDYTQSPVEPSSIFYTPNLVQKTHPARDSQTPSSEDDLDVTVEVCKPSTTIRTSAPEGHTLETRHWEPESELEEYEEIDTNPVVSAHALFPLNSGLPYLAELADLSSITCSPAQLQERLPPSPLHRRPPPCNSTPRSPDNELSVESAEGKVRDQELCDDQMEAVAPVMKSLAKGPSDIPSSLEDTERANSTLDEVLQGMMVERAAGHRVPRSPGSSVCEPERETESVESAGCPRGDYAEAEELKAVDPSHRVSPFPLTNEPTEKLEMGSHGNWSLPHRVIVLEQTPTKSQSGPNQFIRH
ncbi:uncharacterized protein tex14 [Aplochiton taeniatus]